MLKLFIISIFFLLSFAQNPAIYSLLGDVVYNNVDEIKKLSDIPSFSYEKQKILDYAVECEQLKNKGFSIEAGDTKYDKAAYLAELRTLSKVNDQFVMLANSRFADSMENNDTQTFKQLVDLKIVDKSAVKEKVKDFIANHESELENTQYYITYKEDLEKDKLEQERLKKIKDAQQRKEKFSKIERIRDKDKERQDSLHKELEKMVEDKKKEIYKQQKEGLENY